MTRSSSACLLWFIPKHDEDDQILIGVYDDKLEAQKAIERLRMKPGFSGSPEAFQVSEYELNKDHWVEGFIVD